MRSKRDPPAADGKTFIERARRAQLVRCAIEAIAEDGYAQASLARIAERAGISKGVIAYHFAGKDELMAVVVEDVLGSFAAYVVPRMEEQRTAWGALRAFIESNMQFIAAHKQEMLALFEILANARGGDGQRAEGSRARDIAAMEQLLREGQAQGEFRSFDAGVMAVAIMSLRDGVLRQLSHDPELDVAAHERELVTLVELATRNHHDREVEQEVPWRRRDEG